MVKVAVVKQNHSALLHNSKPFSIEIFPPLVQMRKMLQLLLLPQISEASLFNLNLNKQQTEIFHKLTINKTTLMKLTFSNLMEHTFTQFQTKFCQLFWLILQTLPKLFPQFLLNILLQLFSCMETFWLFSEHKLAMYTKIKIVQQLLSLSSKFIISQIKGALFW